MDSPNGPPTQAQPRPPSKQKIANALAGLDPTWNAIRNASMAGVEDPDLTAQFPHVSQLTIRKRRSRDPEWKAAYRAARTSNLMRNPPGARTNEERTANLTKQNKARRVGITQESHLVTQAIIESSLPAISQRNHLRTANLIDRSIAAADRRKAPLPIKTHAELSAALRTLRVACGDDSGEGPQVQLNIWGAPGLQAQVTSPAFRDVGPAPAGD